MIKTAFLAGVVALGYAFLGNAASAQLLYSNEFDQNGATGTTTSLSEAGWTGTDEQRGAGSPLPGLRFELGRLVL